MNRVFLVGRLTKDPTTEYTKDKVARCNFTVAVDRNFATDEKQSTDFIQCVAWRKQAENLAKYQKKGNKILVEGRIQVDNYVNSEGSTVWTTTVVADSIEFLDKKEAE